MTYTLLISNHWGIEVTTAVLSFSDHTMINMNQPSYSPSLFNWLCRQIYNHNIVLLEYYHVTNSKPRWDYFSINEWLIWIIHLTCQESQTAVNVLKLPWIRFETTRWSIMNLLNDSFDTFSNPWRQPLGQNHGGTWKVSNHAYNF